MSLIDFSSVIKCSGIANHANFLQRHFLGMTPQILNYEEWHHNYKSSFNFMFTLLLLDILIYKTNTYKPKVHSMLPVVTLMELCFYQVHFPYNSCNFLRGSVTFLDIKNKKALNSSLDIQISMITVTGDCRVVFTFGYDCVIIKVLPWQPIGNQTSTCAYLLTHCRKSVTMATNW